MNELYVLDLETTGLDYFYDKILEVTIYKLDLQTYKYQLVYNCVVRQDITQRFIQDCWMVQNKYLTLEQIDEGRDPFEVKYDLTQLLQGQAWTSFNSNFDGPFLQKQFEIDLLRPPYCLMLASTDIVRIPRFNGEFKWPTLQEAYYYFYREHKEEKHRAKYDTELAVQIAIALHKFTKNVELLREAIAKELLVVINYTDKKNDATYDRKIAPKQFKRGETLLEAFDYLRGEERTFSIVRINKIAMFNE